MKLPGHRILFVIDSAAFGGAESVVWMLLRGLSARGMACYVACPAKGPMVARYARCAAGMVMFHRRLWHPLVILQIARCIRRWRIDVVHTCLYSSDLAGILAARMSRRTRVIAHVVGYNFLAIDERGIRWLRKRFLSLLHRLLYRWADQVIAVSNAVKHDLTTRPGFKLPATEILVIPHTVWGADLMVPPETLTRARRLLGLPEEAIVCATIGSLISLKGHWDLLHGMRRVVASVPRAVCVVVGDGPQRQMLEQEANRLRLNGHVRFAGALEDELRNAVLHLSCVVVLPSLLEGLSVTLLEAMALAKPVVATNVRGNPEVVEDGITGLLVPPRDPEALASAISRLLSNETLAARLGQDGQRRFQERFSLEQMLQRLEAVYAGTS